MRASASLLHLTARVLERVGLLLHRVGGAFHNLLPVLLPPRESMALLGRYYANTYYARDTLGDPQALETVGFELEPWEADVRHRYGLSSGRMLVLGCGWGREAITLAEADLSVVGLDLHPGVLSIANRSAAERKLPARFLRGDFLAPPCKAGSFDYILLAGTMYSAIPGLETRQRWLEQVRALCKPGALLILSFQIDTRPDGRLDRLTERLRTALVRLPGSNPHYQKGDVCQGGHFFHLFQSEAELKAELIGAGGQVLELNWTRQYAVLTFGDT